MNTNAIYEFSPNELAEISGGGDEKNEISGMIDRSPSGSVSGKVDIVRATPVGSVTGSVSIDQGRWRGEVTHGSQWGKNGHISIGVNNIGGGRPGIVVKGGIKF
jgi:hypothetical protein